jgi:hypothetical protein
MKFRIALKCVKTPAVQWEQSSPETPITFCCGYGFQIRDIFLINRLLYLYKIFLIYTHQKIRMPP